MSTFSFSDTLRRDVEDLISVKLNSLGIMFRLFSRNKDKFSLEKKLENPKYGTTHKIQDALGVRVALYFNDDIELVHSVLNEIFKEREKDHSIDIMSAAEFSAVRYNIIYELPQRLIVNEHVFTKNSEFIDSTFELQIRSILSEGWHEVEHDLRYKAKEDWEGNDIESRKLNGIYATLETSEWTMIKIFDELAYKHYKNGNWDAMLRQKFRLRLSQKDLDAKIINLFNRKLVLAKEIYRIPRRTLLHKMSEKGFSLPLTLNSLIYFSNFFFIQDDELLSITPRFFFEEYSGY
ncbi:RelA/SpoT protein (plasmid) [Pantoea ananatis AJ13355]|uniref:RelA/SpoT protein n=1 Tax=Pantoea ananatis (strain AJ13355) TaxID=932677 RepID=A0A0H3L4E0_PANAA|nr:RelA/SpoT domain-containing protein [Pantoea ananatis]BAK14089.1 RelA/SpoT protein [Pantoea ananatis AJ13355]